MTPDALQGFLDANREQVIWMLESYAEGDLAGKLGLGSKKDALDTLKSLPADQANQFAKTIASAVAAIAPGLADSDDYAKLLSLAQSVLESENPASGLATLLTMLPDSEYQKLLDFLDVDKLAELLRSLDGEALAKILGILDKDQLAAILDALSDSDRLALANALGVTGEVDHGLNTASDPYWFDKLLAAENIVRVEGSENLGVGAFQRLVDAAPLYQVDVGNDISQSNFQGTVRGDLVGSLGGDTGSYSFMANLQTGQASDGTMNRNTSVSDSYHAYGGSGSIDSSGFLLDGFNGSTLSSGIPAHPLDPSTSLQGRYDDSGNWTGAYDVRSELGGGPPSYSIDSGDALPPFIQAPQVP